MYFKIRNDHRLSSDNFRLVPFSACTHRHRRCSWKRQEGVVRSSARLFENDEKIRISVDVPGVKAENLSVKIQDGILHLSGERKFEYSSLTFHKSFALDTNRLDTSQLKANLADGVLVVTAPKRKKAQAQLIEVTESQDNGDESVAMEDGVEGGSSSDLAESPPPEAELER